MQDLNSEVSKFLNSAQSLITERGISRPTLEAILEDLLALAAERSIWGADRYPDPLADVRQARYLISENSDNSFALYLNVMRPGKIIPPHNHTTWACIAPVAGCETNYVYERTDDGAVEGRADLRLLRTVELQGDTGIALMPDDIHSVQINAEDCIRHLHFYGMALETLKDRVIFDIEAGTVKPMTVGVQTQR